MDFRHALHHHRLLADGAMGSELQKQGLPLGTSADAWSLSHPDAVDAVHRAYVATGCEVLLTNTLTASTLYYTAEEATAINRAGVALARNSGATWVAGSMGPGADEVQAAALAGAGCDLFWLETQLGVAQTVASIEACRRVNPQLPVVVSFSFHHPTPITHTGDTLPDIISTLTALNIDALGLNCGQGFAHITEVLTTFAEHTTLPLILKPNAGVPVMENESLIYPLTAQEWAAHLYTLLHSSVKILGGCCGTSPAHLKALATVISPT